MSEGDRAGDHAGPADAAEAWRWLGGAVRPFLGWALAGAGIAAIVAGYLGVSREAVVARQLPYLLSGGLAGLALVFLGGLVLGVDDLRRTTRRLDALEQQVADLHRVLLTDVPGPAGTGGGARPGTGARADAETDAEIGAEIAGAAGGETGAAEAPAANGRGGAGVVALPEGQSYHRSGCAVVRGKDVERLSAAAARSRGLAACRLCDPAAGAVPREAGAPRS